MTETYQLFAPLPDDEYQALKADIAKRGVLVPVEVDETGRVLDGHHRIRAWQELRAEGVRVPDYERLVRVGLSEAEKRNHVRALNLLRRHLSKEELREQMVEMRRDGATLQEIAQATGVDPSTVQRNLATNPEIANAKSQVINARGQVRPARYAPRKVKTGYARNQREQARVTQALKTWAEDVPSKTVTARETPPEPHAETPCPRPCSPLALPSSVVLAVADAAALPLPDGVIDLTVTSPPYGLDKAYGTPDDADGWPDRMRVWLAECYRVTRENGRLAINVPLDTTAGGYRPTYAQTVEAALAVGWTYRTSIVWNEGNVSKTVARGSVDSPRAPHVIAPVEMVALFSKGEWRREPNGTAPDLTHDEWLEWTNGLWSIPGEGRPWEEHPAAFPVELPRRLIKLLSFPGDTVLDPFVGSGTTALVAYQLGRRCCGYDASEEYVASARRRLMASEVNL